MKMSQCPVTPEEKQRMIAHAAYFRSAQRGFANTDPLEDWLAAEAEIEASLRVDCSIRRADASSATRQGAGCLNAITAWWQRKRHRPPVDKSPPTEAWPSKSTRPHENS